MFAPLTVQLFASAGSGFRSGAGPSRTIGVFVLKRTFADVVSVARPGSSDGGSLPIAILSVPPDAFALPELPVFVFPLLLPPPPQPAATRASANAATRPSAQAGVRFNMPVPPRR